MNDMIIVDTQKLRVLAQRINSVKNRLQNLSGRMSVFDNSYSSQSHKLNACITYLNGVADDFDRTEAYLQQFNPRTFKPVQALTNPMLLVHPEAAGIVAGNIVNGVANVQVKAVRGIAEAAKKFWNQGQTGIELLNGKTDNSLYEEGENTAYHKAAHDSTDSKKEGFDKNLGSIFTVGKEWDFFGKQEKDGGKWHEVDGTWNEGEHYNYHIGSIVYDAGAKLRAGLFMYEEKEDGSSRKYIAPGVVAEIGGSIAVAEYDGQLKFGFGENKDLFNFHLGGDLSVLSAEAKGGLYAQVDPQDWNESGLYGGASAEADLAKVTVTPGVTVLGVDINFVAYGSAGAGAHAEAGVQDWKFRAEAGASAGLGGGYGLEVDASRLVNYIQDGTFESLLHSGSKK